MKKTLTTVLLFAGMASAWASGLPDGSYTASCTDISMNGNTLQATCMTWKNDPKRGDAPLVITSYLDNANTCAYVGNRNGQLTCLWQKN